MIVGYIHVTTNAKLKDVNKTESDPVDTYIIVVAFAFKVTADLAVILLVMHIGPADTNLSTDIPMPS